MKFITFKLPKILFAVILPLVLIVGVSQVVHADDKCKSIADLDDRAECYEKEYQSVSKKLSDVQAQKASVSKRISELSGQLTVTQADINELTADIKSMEDQLKEIIQNLEDRKVKLTDKINLRNHLIRNYSKQVQLNNVELFLNSSAYNTGLSGFQFTYISQAVNKAVNSEVINLIQGLNSEIKGFEKDKAESEQIKTDLVSEQNKLVALKNELANKKEEASEDYTELGEKEKSYSEKLEELSEKQQEILKLKGGDENNSVGNYTPPSAKTPDPPFKPAFAAFSYGAYTHYNGMSQYGAKGRADSGKDYKEILKFYYKVDVTDADKKDKDAKINVQGYGEMSYQKYLYGIAEMPSDWPEDALKAQAVAARTYAYRAKKPICTSESCQVFLKSKSDSPPSKWKDAVDATSGKILKDPKTSQYSSTTGGYINNVGWDVNGKWPGDAYEKKAGSPWFYRAWYTKGYSGSDSCGHPHPWLSEKEMADILNSWVVWRKGSGSEKEHISPITTKCWDGDPYSLDEMADKAGKYGEKYSSVSSVDSDVSSSGYTSKVTLQTNRGTVSMSGEEFKTVFNLRAPGYVSIKSRLFDLEKR